MLVIIPYYYANIASNPHTASATAAIRLPKYVRSFKSQKASTDVRVIFAVEASTTELSMLVLSA